MFIILTLSSNFQKFISENIYKVNNPLKKLALPLIATSLLATSSFPVMAIEAGDILVRARAININPDDKSEDVRSNGSTVPNTTVGVEDAYSLDIDFTYMVAKNWGVELLLDISSKHDITAKGSTLKSLAPGTIAQTNVLPPALILQYHFEPDGIIRPYAGLGANYTMFLSEKETNSLENGLGGVSDFSLDDSFGLVAQAGLDYDLGNNWFMNFDVKYMDIDTKGSFQSGALGKVDVNVDINPWVIGVGIGTRF
jgi:outer membrane protein